LCATKKEETSLLAVTHASGLLVCGIYARYYPVKILQISLAGPKSTIFQENFQNLPKSPRFPRKSWILENLETPKRVQTSGVLQAKSGAEK